MKAKQITKNDMARVIVQALYLMPELPSTTHIEVKRLEKWKKEDLAPKHALAVKTIQNKLKEGYFNQ